MNRLRLILPALLLCLPAFGRAETFQDIADRAKPGILGVAACDLHTGIIEGVNVDRPLPMQSVFKAFLAAAILARVDGGDLSLDRKVTLSPGELRGGVGPVDGSGGGTFSVRDLLRAALIESDNSAADALLPLADGPAGVTAWLQRNRIEGIRIDRGERTLARDLNGVPADLSPDQNASALRSRISDPARHAAFEASLTDPRDTATPAAAVRFLIALREGKLLAPDSTRLLLAWMGETRTGAGRLKAGFPPQTALAHKTGTSGTFEGVTLATNDIGLATVPNGKIIAIAVFLAASPAAEADREALIAACARSAATASAPR